MLHLFYYCTHGCICQLDIKENDDDDDLSRLASHVESLEKSGNLKLVRGKVLGEKQKSGKCDLACGQLTRVMFLTQNMQERSSLLDEVVHIGHSCRSYERIYEHCSEK